LDFGQTIFFVYFTLLTPHHLNKKCHWHL
jgi:hypothetical protein